MNSQDSKAFPVFGLVYNIFAIPYNFLIGFIVGVAAPVAVVAAIVAGVRLLTGRMPFLSLDRDSEDGEGHLSLALVQPEEVEGLLEVQKEQLVDELAPLKAEIQSILEEAKAQGQDAAKEVVVEVEVEVEEG